ncbi:hypothetical protein C8R47DRAFT_458407 [Mycena vitilis]|nr:hypothetical protein C8R47DRAFT_458407 [Mycena vitilis]
MHSLFCARRGPAGRGFAQSSLSLTRQPEYQNQYTPVKTEGRLRFAAVLRQPPEILAEIFLHCLPEAHEAMSPSGVPSPSLMAAPLLCVICRRWRDVAVTTPALWRSLYIDFDSLSNKGVCRRGAVEMHQTWLSRAGTTLLLLSLHEEQGVPPGPVLPLLRTIAGLTGQTRAIELDIGQDLADLMFPTAGS